MFNFFRGQPPDDLHAEFRAVHETYVPQRGPRWTKDGSTLHIPILVVGGGTASFDAALRPGPHASDPLSGAGFSHVQLGKLRGRDVVFVLTLLGPRPLEGATGMGFLAQGLALSAAVIVVEGKKSIDSATLFLIDRYAQATVYVFGSAKFIARVPGETEGFDVARTSALEVFKRVAKDTLLAVGQAPDASSAPPSPV